LRAPLPDLGPGRVVTAPAARPKVLVLGRDDRAFLAVVRSLGRHGMRVHIAWCPPDGLTARSRYVVKMHELPGYSPTDDRWKHAFIALCRQEQFDLVVPCNDSSIIPLHTHRAQLQPHARIYLPGPQAFDIAFDKERTYEVARSLGIRVPRGIRLATPADPAAVLAHFPLPVVLKPLQSFHLSDIQQKHLVRKVFAPEDLPRELARFDAEGAVLVQEHFVGTGAGVEGLALDGEVLLAFQHYRIHERPLGGADSYRTNVPVRADLGDAFAKMVKAMAYTGVVMLEFRVNFETGDWALMEINGRFWASLPLAVAAGADFPYYLYQMIVEGKRNFPADYRMGMYCRNWARDAVWLVENLRLPRERRFPLSRLARELGPLLTFRERSDTFTLDDPRPGVADVLALLARMRGWAARVCRERVARLAPVRRLRARRARQALDHAHTVLFLCKGNICRSPFAAAYARTRLGDDVRVLSAGYYPKADRRCPPEAITAARELGVDLGAHRSTVVSQDVVDAAQVIFVFDQENYRTLRARFPSARARIHRLSHLAGDGFLDIRDPYGGPLEDFRAAYRTISRSLDRSRSRGECSSRPRS
jgi:protein-tyrosine-phosphatase/predicted ATP-grasp superfamily ATP-dependent carboligase